MNKWVSCRYYATSPTLYKVFNCSFYKKKNSCWYFEM